MKSSRHAGIHWPLAIAVLLSGCASAPPHFGNFIFQGRVTSAAGQPIGSALVKIRGEESLSDPDGNWSSRQTIHCAGWNEGADAFEQDSTLNVTAEGYQPYEEKLAGRHADWYGGCGSEKTVAFKSVLTPAPASGGTP